MKKISTVLASLPLITTACGGGGSSSDDDFEAFDGNIDLSQVKGIWSTTETVTTTSPSGKTTTFQAPTAIVTSQEQMIILTGNSELYIIEAGTDDTYYFSSFSYSTSITPDVSKSNSNLVFNYYNPKREANGSVTLPPDGHYDSAIDIDSLDGTWTDDYHSSANWEFEIIAGDFTATRSGGCVANGSFSHIDSTKSELAVSMNFNGNCFPLAGTHTGVAWPVEENPNGSFNIAVYNSLDSSGKAMGWKINK